MREEDRHQYCDGERWTSAAEAQRSQGSQRVGRGEREKESDSGMSAVGGKKRDIWKGRNDLGTRRAGQLAARAGRAARVRSAGGSESEEESRGNECVEYRDGEDFLRRA